MDSVLTNLMFQLEDNQFGLTKLSVCLKRPPRSRLALCLRKLEFDRHGNVNANYIAGL